MLFDFSLTEYAARSDGMVSGYTVFDHDDRVADWAAAALDASNALDLTPDRLGRTWHVGVDALPNAADGSVNGIPLQRPWQLKCSQWHPAQISVVYPGFPGRDPGVSEAAHQFRLRRFGAHLDGLLPEGAKKRRHLREPHRFILGIPLNESTQAPLIVWPGSQLIMQAAFRRGYDGIDPENWGDMDVTEVYQAARREVFATCQPEPIVMKPGQSVLLHRHLIHGVGPWDSDDQGKRIVAYFRPQFSDVRDWL